MMPAFEARALLAQVYWKQENPAESKYFLIIAGALFLILIGYSIIKNAVADKGAGLGQRRPQNLSGGAFRRRAEEAGFSSAEAEFLEFYARKLGVTSPQSVFGSKTLLDAFMRNAFKYIERHAETEDMAEEQKHRLFAIREALGSRSSSGSAPRSTRQLKPKTPLSIVTSKEAHYSSILIVNESRAMYLEPALDAFGSPIRIQYGSKLTLYFYSGNHVGYSFQSRSRGMVDIDGKKFLSIAHSDRIKPLPARRNQRSEVRLSGRFYLVHVRAARDKGKVVKTVQVERAAVAGIITDLSGGGLSLQTMSPANVGEFIKVEFDLGTGQRSAYATVVRVSKTRNGALMHLKFVKASRKTINEIRSVVYGYD
ncbi:MAG TPA: PilZ domain-containing protein [Spirochaetales bacterium]|nr:PilZ domain-containing protein [Spirochaetales bacterium]